MAMGAIYNTKYLRVKETSQRLYAARQPSSTCKGSLPLALRLSTTSGSSAKPVRPSSGHFSALSHREYPTVAHPSPTPIRSASVSPTLVASLPGTPSDLSDAALDLPFAADSAHVADISASTISTPAVSGTPESDGESTDLYYPTSYSPHPSRLKRRRADPDCLIDVHPRPSKLLRQSLVDPAADHNMRYNGPGPSASASTSTSSLALNGDSNGVDGLATNGYGASKSSLELVRPTWGTLYKDSQLDREQVMRTILQALRDVGYA
ncbi:hypothetical protein FRC12_019976 [Ceratobasidium sp. 428]|nr:hypothetical protein FRC12_019976 [Ceratobasidium sp. 428]